MPAQPRYFVVEVNFGSVRNKTHGPYKTRAVARMIADTIDRRGESQCTVTECSEDED